MTKPKMTYSLAHSVGLDTGNRSKKKGGRTKWSRTDYNAAVREFNRVFPP